MREVEILGVAEGEVGEEAKRNLGQVVKSHVEHLDLVTSLLENYYISISKLVFKLYLRPEGFGLQPEDVPAAEVDVEALRAGLLLGPALLLPGAAGASSTVVIIFPEPGSHQLFDSPIVG